MERGSHLQNSPSTVWDTALLSYALQEAQVPKASKVIHNASAYLLRKQQTKKVDWSVHAPDLFPGGWGFSDVNTTIPDIDDTTAALRALARSRGNENVDTAWKRAVNWVKGLQNNDGGWGLLKRGNEPYISKFTNRKCK